jgi:hypothetical protein
MPTQTKEVTTALIREFSGEDILCLHAICQPLVTDLQAVIRHQQELLRQSVEAMEYSIWRQRDNLVGTQQYTNLTRVISQITGEDLDALRDRFIPGSSSIHNESR